LKRELEEEGIMKGHTVYYIVGAALGISMLACVQQAPYVPPDNQTSENPDTFAEDSEDDAVDGARASLKTVERDVLETRCMDESRAQACLDFARVSVGRMESQPQLAARSVQALYQACELGRGDACYLYGLMTWLQLGAEHSPDEIRYAFERANELGYIKARVPADALMTPARGDFPATPESLYHFQQACGFGVMRACGIFSAQTEGRDVTLPDPERMDSSMLAPPPTPPSESELFARDALGASDPRAPEPEEPEVTITEDSFREQSSEDVFRSDDPAPLPTPEPAPELAPEPAPSTAPPATGAPRASSLDLRVDGTLDRSKATSVVESRQRQLQYCFSKGQRTDPSLRGLVIAEIRVKPDGTVQKADLGMSELASAEALGCMEKLIGLWRFPKTRSKGPSIVTFSMEFGF